MADLAGLDRVERPCKPTDRLPLTSCTGRSAYQSPSQLSYKHKTKTTRRRWRKPLEALDAMRQAPARARHIGLSARNPMAIMKFLFSQLQRWIPSGVDPEPPTAPIRSFEAPGGSRHS